MKQIIWKFHNGKHIQWKPDFAIFRLLCGSSNRTPDVFVLHSNSKA